MPDTAAQQHSSEKRNGITTLSNKIFQKKIKNFKRELGADSK